MRKWIAAALLVIGAVTIPMTWSVAQPPDAQGWWWLYRKVEPPVDPKAVVPNYNGAPEAPPPASVPEDGLYVAGNPSGPEAIAALSFALPEGGSGKTLTLVAATPLTPATSIRLCPTNTAWQPVQAGTWSSKPLYQCATDAPVGVVPADGAKVVFTLGAMGLSRLIDVALVPTDQSVFQASFKKPDKDALEVTTTGTDTSQAGTGAAVLGSGEDYGSLNYAVNTPEYVPDLAQDLQPGQDFNSGAAPTLNYPQSGNAVPVAQTSTRDNLETFGIFGLIALAALFSRYRAQPDHQPKSLVNFGKPRETEVS